MFVIVAADGSIRRTFKGTDAATVIELSCELRCADDSDFTKRIAEARRLLTEDTTWLA
jgi:hypothetical protein